MANAIFTASESSAYDDLIEERYHFPHTYLRQVEATVGDFIIYYEPRRTTGHNSAAGRQAYFAIAQVKSITRDPKHADHYYAQMQYFLPFYCAVPFRDGTHYHESRLKKEDGTTNMGTFRRAVRSIPANEFANILKIGMSATPEPWELADRVAEPVPEYVIRPLVEQVGMRKFRDVAFRRHIRNAYANTCKPRTSVPSKQLAPTQFATVSRLPALLTGSSTADC
jgi:putative restriction endonuclease